MAQPISLVSRAIFLEEKRDHPNYQNRTITLPQIRNLTVGNHRIFPGGLRGSFSLFNIQFFVGAADRKRNKPSL